MARALTAEDVCDSFRLLSTEGHERIRITIRDVEACEVLGPHEVRYRFKGERTRDLPLTVARLADLLQGLLRQGGLLEVDAGAAAGLRPLQDQGLQARRICGL